MRKRLTLSFVFFSFPCFQPIFAYFVHLQFFDIPNFYGAVISTLYSHKSGDRSMMHIAQVFASHSYIGSLDFHIQGLGYCSYDSLLKHVQDMHQRSKDLHLMLDHIKTMQN